MRMVTFLSSSIDPSSVQREAASAAQKLGSTPKLVVLYLPIHSQQQAPRIARSVREAAGGCSVIGCSTGGAAFTESGSTTRGIAGAVLGGDDLEVRTALSRRLRADCDGSVRNAFAQLEPLKTSAVSALVFADAFACDGDQLVGALRKSMLPHWRAFGGLAGDDWQFRSSFVLLDDLVTGDAAVVALLGTSGRPGVAVRHGFKQATGSSPMKITGAQGNSLQSLNDRPASDVYCSALQQIGQLRRADDFLAVAARHPLGARTPFGEGLKIRTPMAVGNGGVVNLAGAVNMGAEVQVVTADDDALIEAARELARDAGNGQDAQFVVDCAGRRQLLGRRYDEQLAAFGMGGSAPLLGFASYGEIARFGGSIEGFHNTTAVMARY